MARMYDSISPTAIPLDAPIVAGYINGRYAWNQSGWDRFPNAAHVRIVIFGTNLRVPTDDGDVLDIEAGDASRARRFASEWVTARRSAGIVPTIYTSKSGLLYVGGLPCDYWIADPGDPHILPGTVATQWGYEGAYDVSDTVDYWPRKPGDIMPNAPCVTIKLTKSGKGYWLFGADGGVFAYGDARFFGSIPQQGTQLHSLITTADVTDTEAGYVMAGGDYGVFAFGDAPFLGHP